MPTYEYRCESCGEFEVVQKITDDALKVCPKCGSSVTRLVSAAAFHLKGSGWYKTDYASGSSSAQSYNHKSPETKSEAEKTSTEGSAEKKPAHSEAKSSEKTPSK